MMDMILDFVRSEKSPPSLVHLCFKFLYIICKVGITEILVKRACKHHHALHIMNISNFAIFFISLCGPILSWLGKRL